jgi:hypothetical protein
VAYTLTRHGPGAGGGARKFSTGDIAVHIPDRDTVFVPIDVPNPGLVEDVDVRVRIDHTAVGDLDLRVWSPGGFGVPLYGTIEYDFGDDFGTGKNSCRGTKTVFDDSADVSIEDGRAPFAGTYRPRGELSGLRDMPIAGTWTLEVSDGVQGDSGTIGCFELLIKYHT